MSQELFTNISADDIMELFHAHHDGERGPWLAVNAEGLRVAYRAEAGDAEVISQAAVFEFVGDTEDKYTRTLAHELAKTINSENGI